MFDSKGFTTSIAIAAVRYGVLDLQELTDAARRGELSLDDLTRIPAILLQVNRALAVLGRTMRESSRDTAQMSSVRE